MAERTRAKTAPRITPKTLDMLREMRRPPESLADTMERVVSEAHRLDAHRRLADEEARLRWEMDGYRYGR
jgi:hypothetical protein